MSIEEAEGVVEEIYDRIDPDARIIWGTSIDETLEGSMRTMIVVTGVQSPQIYGRPEGEAVQPQGVGGQAGGQPPAGGQGAPGEQNPGGQPGVDAEDDDDIDFVG